MCSSPLTILVALCWLQKDLCGSCWEQHLYLMWRFSRGFKGDYTESSNLPLALVVLTVTFQIHERTRGCQFQSSQRNKIAVCHNYLFYPQHHPSHLFPIPCLMSNLELVRQTVLQTIWMNRAIRNMFICF